MTDPVKQAAHWLATTPDASKPRPIVPYLRQKFSLTAVQAVGAITAARALRIEKDNENG